MKTIIAGGRDYTFTDDDRKFLNGIKDSISEVVCGGAPGADNEGKVWAEQNDIAIKLFPADWKKYGRGAGPKRNRMMAEYANCLVLFTGGRGSSSIFKEAQSKNLKIHDLRK